jgi:3-methyladenine DNA glycosylase AlkD
MFLSWSADVDADEIVAQLRDWGAESYKKVLANHGVKEPVFGVKISELKKIQKRVKKDYQLALDLFATGIYDAQYLAGLIADEQRMTKRDLRRWLATGNCTPICGTVVAWVAAESRYGFELSMEWIESTKESVAQTGWTTLASLVSIRDDTALDLVKLKQLLGRVEKTIHREPNLVRYAMNSFVISVGAYVSELTAPAIQTATKIGKVSVDMGKTACQVPSAVEYIQKIQARGTIGKKRKTARC